MLEQQQAGGEPEHEPDDDDDGRETSTTPAATGTHDGRAREPELGQILVDSKGMTLYVDEKDKPGAPNCTGAASPRGRRSSAPASPTFGAGLDRVEVLDGHRADGTKQLAVNGFPLYTWTNDKKPGDATGQDVNGFYVVGKDYKKIEGQGS